MNDSEHIIGLLFLDGIRRNKTIFFERYFEVDRKMNESLFEVVKRII